MKEVVKKWLLKWLDVSILYAISDSKWVSSTQCVPKKGGLIVFENDKNELISKEQLPNGECALIIGS